MRTTVIVGLGSPHGDDQLGWAAIDRLRSWKPDHIAAHKADGGIELLELLAGHETAIIIDAAAPAGRPGTVRSFEWPCPELAECAPWSTHGLGLVDAIRLAESLGQRPRRVIVHTIEARQESPGAPLSAELAQPLDAVLETVRRQLAE